MLTAQKRDDEFRADDEDGSDDKEIMSTLNILILLKIGTHERTNFIIYF